jgi:hypothetical protein
MTFKRLFKLSNIYVEICLSLRTLRGHVNSFCPWIFLQGRGRACKLG